VSTNSTARMLHAIAEELGCDPELVGVVRSELKLRKRVDIVEAVKARLSREEPVVDEPTEPKVKKASLTLSQRRALLRLLDERAIRPASGFKALPFEHLVAVGYATAMTDEPEGECVYTLTEAGVERAQSINPGYRIWSSGETVAGDPNRPVAGTHRTKRIEAEEAEEAVAETVEA
jgi:hypothetical protein